MGLSRKQVKSIIQKGRGAIGRNAGDQARRMAAAPRGGVFRVGAIEEKQLRAGLQTVGDPGPNGTITSELKARAYCEVTTSGAESRAIDDAKRFTVGNELTVLLKAGGPLTVTGSADGSVELSDPGDLAIFRVSKEGEATTDHIWRTIYPAAAGIGGNLGANDNALVRVDGTDGDAIQSSSVFTSDTGWINQDNTNFGLHFGSGSVTELKSENGEPVLKILNPDGSDGGFHFRAPGGSELQLGNNLFIGASAGASLTTGNSNIGFGSSALILATQAEGNIAIGSSAGSSISTGLGNIAIGSSALFDVVGGSGNIALGSVAGGGAGDSCLCIGGGTSVSGSNKINIFDFLVGDHSAAVLELRKDTTNCTFAVHNTFSSSTSYERLQIDWSSNVARIVTQKGSGGGTARDLVLGTDNTERLRIGATTGDITLAEGVDILSGTTTGTKIGTATTQKLALWGATPIVQPAHANQAALTDSTGGTADGTVADVGSSFSQATLNNNFADVIRLVNQLRSDLVAAGIIKGVA